MAAVRVVCAHIVKGGALSRQSSPQLTQQSVGLLLSKTSKATTVGAIAWKSQRSVTVGLLQVRTVLPELEQGIIRVHIRWPAPSQPRYQYLIGGASVRRLCVNDPHPPYDGTHKHMINPLGSEEDAYQPTDIPAVPLAPRVAPGTYRAILEAFAGECEVSLGEDFVWTEPGRRA
ncbi:hypothetical protein [Streptomyces europaeiscabiei]|uniref:hypothetical protein n=1 Tax=Streptomyces europaeiscabiei TaxID=146819 RepID=UPI0029AE02F8|nr:hypothetical protein [Streptomyces europaeiscabiei]MDX3866866.1 hypothetical protein [Streptomyces europaeiscabiei]MDX3873106.1 hypothetical protein [Streptomyces europaeiscabiei]